MAPLPYFSDWPSINSSITKDSNIEFKVQKILDQMTLEEKIGQMIQPNLRDVTPEEAQAYKLGSLLNGGGTWANNDKYASALDWAKTADEYWTALQEAYNDRPFSIPFMWATDAVHGHNNIFGATLFPHNIGLGAAYDPDLIYRIGIATAKEVTATGMDWTFAPTVATPRNLHWGRVYEGYSEDPEIVYHYAGKMVEGLQGNPQDLRGEHRVISNVKHWIGDGGTIDGVDRGNNAYTEEQLLNIHAMGYISGLNAGAQVVMSSFSGWLNDKNVSHDNQAYNDKLSGSHYLLTEVLKNKMGFDGVIVSDWNSHAEVIACEDGNANYCINAGLDILMVTARNDWKSTISHAIEGVQSGEIPLSRINDAVTRILRIKMRAGLWEKPKPTERVNAGQQDTLGHREHKKLAREAVRKSLVLLKNKNNALPLTRKQSLILTGSAANNIQKMTGGWSMTWQGSDTTPDDFPGCQPLLKAIESVNTLSLTHYIESLTPKTQLPDAEFAIVAIGEDPYAEIVGDIKSWQTLEYSKLKRAYRSDLETIRTLKKAGKKVITLFFSGRPLYVNEEINLSDAFVAAWLPGTEGAGITDIIFKNSTNDIEFDFQGKLSFSWPKMKHSFAVNRIPPHIPNYQIPQQEQNPNGKHAPLFNVGYGLNYQQDINQQMDLDNIPLDLAESASTETIATQAIEFFGVLSTGDFALNMADHNCWLTGVEISGNNASRCATIESMPIDYIHQQDGRKLIFLGGDAMVYLQSIDQSPINLKPYLNAQGYLTIAIKLIEPPSGKVELAVHRDIPNSPTLDITSRLSALPLNEWSELSVSLAEFDLIGCEFEHVNTPFMLFTTATLSLELGKISYTV